MVDIINAEKLRIVSSDLCNVLKGFSEKHNINGGELSIILEQYILIRNNAVFMKAYEQTKKVKNG